MAERAPNIDEVRATLLRAAERLSSLSSSAPSTGQTSSSASYSQASLPPAQSSSSSTSFSAAAEQRRLFGHYRASSKSRNAAGHGKKKRVPTTTLKFVCLASKNATAPPSTVKERTSLSNMGLGDGSMVCQLDGVPVYSMLEEKYPKLSSVGGYDLLLFQRGSGEDSGFHIIQPPHTPAHLKELCGHAKIFIRPVQQDIMLDNNDAGTMIVPEDEKIQNDVPLINCFMCGTSVRMNDMRQHQEDHHKTRDAKRQKTLDDNICESTLNLDLPSTSGMSQSLHALQEICPSASDLDIQGALSASNGNVDDAAQRLLGVPTVTLMDVECDDLDADDADLLVSTFDYESATSDLTPADALQLYKTKVVESNQPSQRFMVCRMDGIGDLRKDIMGIYKNPNTKLKVAPRVRYEGEEGVGSGPVREFLSSAMRIVDEGIPSSSGKPLLFFEGEEDHRLPIHDRSLRLTGAFNAAGRIIGHSILHGGPGLYGLSPAVKQYLTEEQHEYDQHPPPIVLSDIADLELRQLISEVDSLPKGEHATGATRFALEPYLYEAGLDPDNLYGNAKLVIDGLMIFQVIHKRRLELDEIAKGMEDVSLHSSLIKCPSLANFVFPNQAERVILGEEVKNSLSFMEKDTDVATQRTAVFFVDYIDEIESRIEDGAQMCDLITFWTGGSAIATLDGRLLVKFDGGANKLPLSETCFRTIILPSMHTSYEEFRSNMDIELKYGSRGFSFN